MPELPDLQVFSRNLQRSLSGKKVNKILIGKGAKLNVTAAVVKRTLEGQKLQKVFREGKELRLSFGKHILGIHLMLRGKLYWIDDKPKPHTLLEIDFGEKKLGLTDYQRNARVSLNPEISPVPDALSARANLSFWKEILQSRATIKNILLDQHNIRGIGNAYADEILWRAGISPFSIGKEIPLAKIKSLVRSVKQVLKSAEKQIAKKEPHIIGGEVRDFLLIHNAGRKTSPNGKKILQKSAGGRKTYYTAEQELFS